VPAVVPPPLVAEDVRVSAGMSLPKAVPAPNKTLEPKHDAPALAHNVVPDARSLPMPDPVGRADGTMTSAIPSPSAVKLSSSVPTGATLLPGSGFVETSRLPVAVVSMAVNPIPLIEVQTALSSNPSKGLRVRTSDLINSFAYSYEPPHADEAEPIRVSATMTTAPWQSSHRLVRVAMQARLGAEEVVARDVSLEVVFDPTQVSAYRMLGYEPFAGSTADSVPQGVTMKAGQSFTALFEVVPANEALPKDQLLADGMAPDATRKPEAPKAKAATRSQMRAASGASPMRVRMHFQKATSASAEVVELLVPSTVTSFEASDADFQFATALAGVGWLVANPDGQEPISWSQVRQWAVRGEGGRAERADLTKILNSRPASK